MIGEIFYIKQEIYEKGLIFFGKCEIQIYRNYIYSELNVYEYFEIKNWTIKYENGFDGIKFEILENILLTSTEALLIILSISINFYFTFSENICYVFFFSLEEAFY